MYISWYGVSDVGTVKDVNQDTILCDLRHTEDGDIGIFAVADGVGGLEYGEIASSTAIDTLRRWWDSAVALENATEVLSETLVSNISAINKAISDYPYDMATTLSVLLVLNDKYLVLHIGDSRIYCYKSGLMSSFEQITPDHSTMVLKNLGGITQEKSVLTDCLGKMSKSEYYSAAAELEHNDLFMLCSDGVYKKQSEKDIKQIISQHKKNMTEACRSLINGAKANGETDNVSAITVRISKRMSNK